MDIDLYYMLLNPVDINNWHIQDAWALENMRAAEESRRSFGKYGVGIEIPVRDTRRILREVIIQARDRYMQSLNW
jgi:hypothetical protein